MSNVFDPTLFFGNFQTAGIPLLFLIIGFVQFVKPYAQTSRGLRIGSLIFGLILGVGYWLSVNPIVATFGFWFTAVIFGLTLGFTATKVYDAAVDAAAKGQLKAEAIANSS